MQKGIKWAKYKKLFNSIELHNRLRRQCKNKEAYERHLVMSYFLSSVSYTVFDFQLHKLEIRQKAFFKKAQGFERKFVRNVLKMT